MTMDTKMAKAHIFDTVKVKETSMKNYNVFEESSFARFSPEITK